MNSNAKVTPLEHEERIFILLSSMIYGSQFAVGPIYVIFLLSKGLNYSGVAIVDSSFLVTLLFTDYLTGALADRFGRKLSVSMAFLLWGGGMLVYFFSTHLFEFVVSEVIAGIGMAFYSGSLEAWLYDTLKEKNLEKNAGRTFGLSGTYGSLIGAISAIISGWVASYYLSLPFLIAAAFGIIGSLIAFRCVFESRSSHENEVITVMKALRLGLSVSKQNRTLMALIFSLSILFFAYPFLNLYWQPRLIQLGSPIELLGFSAAGMAIASALTSYISSKLNLKGKFKLSALVGMSIIGVFAFLASYAVNYAVLFFLLVAFRGGWGFVRPSTSAWTNSEINSKGRATVLSFQSTFITISGILGMLTSGYLADTYSISIVFLLASILFLASLLITAGIRSKSLPKTEISVRENGI